VSVFVLIASRSRWINGNLALFSPVQYQCITQYFSIWYIRNNLFPVSAFSSTTYSSQFIVNVIVNVLKGPYSTYFTQSEYKEPNYRLDDPRRYSLARDTGSLVLVKVGKDATNDLHAVSVTMGEVMN
jgi:hypothetical protein